MENISRLSPAICHPWAIEIHSYLYDHHLDGKTIYPAAEALITLAKAVKVNFPQAEINSMTDAYFPRFLAIPAKTKVLEASVDIETGSERGITARLLSSVKAKTGNISRTVEHARVRFAGHAGNQLPLHPFRALAKLEGECINVPAAAIYRELVPFGDAYQNISGDLSVSRDGALAYVSGGDTEANDDFLGSPFPFDAVLHAACVWAQRFTGVVAFPVGFTARIIYKKTKKRAIYLGRIVPVAHTDRPFIFNAWIYDMQGAVCETIAGIQMQDVSRGRMKPPAWIKQV